MLAVAASDELSKVADGIEEFARRGFELLERVRRAVG
jgi:hypothetical protein